MRSNWNKCALDEVREVYSDLSLRPIERNCVRVKECCHFKLTGRTPYLTKGEALLAAKALRATGRTHLPENSAGACPSSIPPAATVSSTSPVPSVAAPIFARLPAGPTRAAKSLISFADSKR
ncbi:MAG TPA: hypothetical protein VF345_08735 [Chthoniobacterales bacterium]